MKKVIVVAAALLASSAQATSGLDFGDINYLLKSGQFNLTSNLNVVNEEVQDEAGGAGGASISYEKNGYIIDNRFAFGIADNLNVFVGLDYAWDYKMEVPGSSNSDNSGFSNPRVGAIYRAANQSDSLLNVDFGVVGNIKVMDAERGMNTGKSGNYYGGNNSLELNTRIGRKWNEANEWQLTAGAIRNFDGKYDEVTGAGKNTIDTDASTDFYLKAGYQYRPVQEFMMLVQGTAIRKGSMTAKDENGVKIKDDSYVDYNFLFKAKYLVTEKFIVNFNYGLNHLAEYDRVRGGTTSEQKNRFANSYGFGLDWLF
ncbi:MAG: hypothetical protein ACJ76H_15920 [Bacteriovoracaceae bacterium]